MNYIAETRDKTCSPATGLIRRSSPRAGHSHLRENLNTVYHVTLATNKWLRDTLGQTSKCCLLARQIVFKCQGAIETYFENTQRQRIEAILLFRTEFTNKAI